MRRLLNAEATLKQKQAAYDMAYKRDPAGIGGSSAGLDLEKATNDYNAAKANYDKEFEETEEQLGCQRRRVSCLCEG